MYGLQIPVIVFKSLVSRQPRACSKNIVFVPQIDYRVESILEKVALIDSTLIFHLFDERIQTGKEKDKEDEKSRYEDIPYELHF
ncbi:hypothetical protein [Aliamphritea spongicola]|nr:hypothetical protein [Aliamphritea spongicola]